MVIGRTHGLPRHASGRPFGADVGQIAVVARDVAAQGRLHFLAGRRGSARERLVVHVEADEEIDLGVREFAETEIAQSLWTEELRSFAAQRQQVLGGLADVVLRVRVGRAIGDALPVGRSDVGDAEGRALNGHVARAGARRARAAADQRAQCDAARGQTKAGNGVRQHRFHGVGMPGLFVRSDPICCLDQVPLEVP